MPIDNPTRLVIGLSAGPSADGVDAAMLRVKGHGLAMRPAVERWLTEPYPRELRDLIVRASAPGQSSDVRQIALAHRLLGETLAFAARQVADQASTNLQHVLVIGCMGHTAWHETDGRFPATLCLGAAAVLAERTGVACVSDFRWRDLATGGQGTPVTALAEWLLFRNGTENRLVLHLGGLAHAAYLPPLVPPFARGGEGGWPRSVLAWEAGPCNVLLDALISEATNGKERFDTGGKLAVQGRVIPELLSCWMSHPFILRRPPKSTHRSLFSGEFARQTLALARQKDWPFQDVLCTANRFVAEAIEASVQRHVPRELGIDRILLSGGGTRNGMLWRLLEERLPGIPISKSDSVQVPAEAKEAAAAALLACLFLDGVPGNIPSVTGAAGARLLGSLTPGSFSNWARCVAWMNGQFTDPLEEDT